MKIDEFVEFVFRISCYVYDAKSYEKVPNEVEKLIDESIYVKFRETLR